MKNYRQLLAIIVQGKNKPLAATQKKENRPWRWISRNK